MRNILITVMMLILVAWMFSSIVADKDTGLRGEIQTKAESAKSQIRGLGVS